eukprot:Skav207381  [mRNA]  locus=scaffold2496:162767:164349:+ [translate_table: standard]
MVKDGWLRSAGAQQSCLKGGCTFAMLRPCEWTALAVPSRSGGLQGVGEPGSSGGLSDATSRDRWCFTTYVWLASGFAAMPRVGLPVHGTGRHKCRFGAVVWPLTPLALQIVKRKLPKKSSAHAMYPVCLTAITDMSKPHHLRICNVPVVFWHDGSAWRAAVDECPHRRVRLSEGRLEGDGQFESLDRQGAVVGVNPVDFQ